MFVLGNTVVDILFCLDARTSTSGDPACKPLRQTPRYGCQRGLNPHWVLRRGVWHATAWQLRLHLVSSVTGILHAPHRHLDRERLGGPGTRLHVVARLSPNKAVLGPKKHEMAAVRLFKWIPSCRMYRMYDSGLTGVLRRPMIPALGCSVARFQKPAAETRKSTGLYVSKPALAGNWF